MRLVITTSHDALGPPKHFSHKWTHIRTHRYVFKREDPSLIPARVSLVLHGKLAAVLWGQLVWDQPEFHAGTRQVEVWWLVRLRLNSLSVVLCRPQIELRTTLWRDRRLTKPAVVRPRGGATAGRGCSTDHLLRGHLLRPGGEGSLVRNLTQRFNEQITIPPDATLFPWFLSCLCITFVILR